MPFGRAPGLWPAVWLSRRSVAAGKIAFSAVGRPNPRMPGSAGAALKTADWSWGCWLPFGVLNRLITLPKRVRMRIELQRDLSGETMMHLLGRPVVNRASGCFRSGGEPARQPEPPQTQLLPRWKTNPTPNEVNSLSYFSGQGAFGPPRPHAPFPDRLT